MPEKGQFPLKKGGAKATQNGTHDMPYGALLILMYLAEGVISHLSFLLQCAWEDKCRRWSSAAINVKRKRTGSLRGGSLTYG